MESKKKTIALGKRLISETDIFSMDPNQDRNSSDGVYLDASQREYMLPHFLMLLVGKPGSGKTSVLQKLITSTKFYKQKFDKIFIISPSYQKLAINVDEKNKTADFSLNWIFEKIDGINSDQEHKATTISTEKGMAKGTLVPVVGGGQSKNKAVLGILKPSDIASKTSMMQDLSMQMLGTSAPMFNRKSVAKKSIENSFLKLPIEMQKAVPHVNVLFIFDDVVGQIKKAESDPRIARLFFNRRHLINRGTISLMVVTQKYMRIPTQIRSNASWLILFKINPKDFNNVYEDAVSLSKNKWDDIMQFAFDMDSDGVSIAPSKQKKDQEKGEINTVKSYNTLGIWVEKDVYFKNFQRLILQ